MIPYGLTRCHSPHPQDKKEGATLEMNPWLRNLAEQAGEIALEIRRGGKLNARSKKDGSPVTAADLAVDAYLREEIGARYPEDTLLTEESADPADRLAARRAWIIDPIDGTSVFVRGEAEFAVLIARCEAGVSVESIAHFPVLNLTLYAAGASCNLNGRETAVSQRELADARIGGKGKIFARHHALPYPIKSTALELVRLASGEVDGLLIRTGDGTGEHDYAWASCAVAAAGGKLTDIDGLELAYNKPERSMPRVLVASNGRIHDALLERARAVQDATV